MIVVDTSALMAILNGEPESDACIDVLSNEIDVLISAATMAEALIVSSARHFGEDMAVLFDRFGCQCIAVTAATAKKAAEAYAQWGKGFHPASLNFGDCFAYALARERNCPLLFVGRDFAATDLRAALPQS